MKHPILQIITLFVIASFSTLNAQPVPANEVADFTFERGLEMYNAKDYNMAYQRFARVINEFPLNTKTTASLLMAGKALYNQGLMQEAADIFQRLIVTFPDSKYVSEAQALRSQAVSGNVQTGPTDVFDLGITLPLSSLDFTKSMFDGIRMAVDEYNFTNPSVPVRMVFRDSGGEGGKAVVAVTELIRDGDVESIIGPLFSQVARDAGEIAERSQVVLFAPMATDGDVSAGRRYVFQASSTYKVRGVVMARYAVQDLGQRSLGVIYEKGTPNEETAIAFQEEAQNLGATIAFSRGLDRASDWERLSRVVGSSTINSATAVYLPVSGRNALRSIEGALNSLDEMRATTIVLGNTDWHDLDINNLQNQASRYRTAYTSDFYAPMSDPNVASFIARFRQLSGNEPDNLGLAYAGYDLAKFIIQQRNSISSGSELLQQIHRAQPYYGVGRRFDFRNGNINEGAFLLRYRNGEIVTGE